MTELVCVEEIVKLCTRAGYEPVLSRMNHCMEKKAGAWKGTLVRNGMALITTTPLRVMMKQQVSQPERCLTSLEVAFSRLLDFTVTVVSESVD
jgi:hypothetical protein